MPRLGTLDRLFAGEGFLHDLALAGTERSERETVLRAQSSDDNCWNRCGIGSTHGDFENNVFAELQRLGYECAQAAFAQITSPASDDQGLRAALKAQSNACFEHVARGNASQCLFGIVRSHEIKTENRFLEV